MQVSTSAMLSCSAMMSDASSRLASTAPGPSAGLWISAYSVSLSISVISWLFGFDFNVCGGSVFRRGLRFVMLVFCCVLMEFFGIGTDVFKDFRLAAVIRDGRREPRQLPV